MIKFRNSLILKVVIIITLTQSAVWFLIANTLQKHQSEWVYSLNSQQKKFIVNFIEKQKNRVQKEVFTNLKKIIHFSKSSLSYSLFNYEEESAKKVLQNLLSDKNIKAIEIYDTVGKDMFIAAYKKKNKIIFTKKQIPENFMLYKFIKENLVYNGQLIGYVKIYYDLSNTIRHLNDMEKEELSLVNVKFQKINKQIKNNEEKIFIYFLIAALFSIMIVAAILVKFVNQPLREIKNGLANFFDFLADPSNKIQPINIKTNDEFGEIADFTNKGIAVSYKLHMELAELMKVVDKYVMIIEFDENGRIIKTTSVFNDVCGYGKNEILNKKINIFDKTDIENIIKKIKINNEWSGEIQCKTKKREKLWLYSNITKKCNVNNECKYINISYNITDQKELELLKNNLEQLVEEKTKKIKTLLKMTEDSIKYASMIQKSLLPSEEIFTKCFNDYFVIWEPKDVVGGDIYFLDEVRKNEYILMVIDCTGHGVHGAFMTMLVKAVQRQIIDEINLSNEKISPSEILSRFNIIIKSILYQDTNITISNAGFDGAVVYYNKNEKSLKYAGAKVPVFYIDADEKLFMIKGDRSSVGDKRTSVNHKYTDYDIPLKGNMEFYITTDGFLDQNGGKRGFPFAKKRFKDLIKKYHNLNFKKQKEIFIEELRKYQSEEIRNDDVTVIGFKI